MERGSSVTLGDPIIPPGSTWSETTFVTKDSGERVEFDSGMKRDVEAGKIRWDLVPIPMRKRVAELYTRGAVKYGDSNWTLADSEEELARFKRSAERHFMSWLMGERDEDHMAAVVFNLFAAETLEAKLADDVALEEHLSDETADAVAYTCLGCRFCTGGL
jgi:hypothetical protein